MKILQLIKKWRRSRRTKLLERRLAVPYETRLRSSSIVIERILDQIPNIGSAAIAFYWPIKGELDLRELISTCLHAGATASLPIVVGKNQPLQFWSWSQASKMVRGFCNIPVPAEKRVVQPTILLVPLLGFDAAGYRLGYGGGYYDRTLASLSPKPITVGVGYDCCRLASIHPQSHDIPMDATVTETEFKWRDLPTNEGYRTNKQGSTVSL